MKEDDGMGYIRDACRRRLNNLTNGNIDEKRTQFKSDIRDEILKEVAAVPGEIVRTRIIRRLGGGGQ